jgi:hypothetical protein
MITQRFTEPTEAGADNGLVTEVGTVGSGCAVADGEKAVPVPVASSAPVSRTCGMVIR